MRTRGSVAAVQAAAQVIATAPATNKASPQPVVPVVRTAPMLRLLDHFDEATKKRTSVFIVPDPQEKRMFGNLVRWKPKGHPPIQVVAYRIQSCGDQDEMYARLVADVQEQFGMSPLPIDRIYQRMLFTGQLCRSGAEDEKRPLTTEPGAKNLFLTGENSFRGAEMLFQGWVERTPTIRDPKTEHHMFRCQVGDRALVRVGVN